MAKPEIGLRNHRAGKNKSDIKCLTNVTTKPKTQNLIRLAESA
jgi:hypothetical protein